MMKKILALLLSLQATTAFGAAKIQNEDVKSLSQLNSAGSDGTHLINDSKIWASAVTPPQQLSTAISSGLIGGGGGGQGKNYLSDANGQGFPASSAWTVTAGTGSADTTNYTDGAQSIKVTAAAQQSKLFQDVTPTAQMQNVQLQAAVWVKTSMTTVQVCGRAGGLQQNCQPVMPSNTWQLYTSTFIGPASGSIGVEVSLTSSDTGSFNAQLAYVGKATTIGSVSQAQFLGSVQFSGCSPNSWSRGIGVGSYGPMNGTTITGCTYTTYGSALAPTTTIPGIRFASMPAGEYVIKFEGSATVRGASAGNEAYWRFFDGTNYARETSMMNAPSGSTNIQYPGFQQTFSYANAQSNVTWQIYGAGSGSGSDQYIYGDTNHPGTISVYYFPAQQQLVTQANTTPANYSGTMTSTGGWTGSTLTYPTYGDWQATTGISLAQVTSTNISCSTPSSGSTIAITCILPRAGNYQVGVAAMFGNSSQNFMIPRLVDGSGTIIDSQGAYPGQANGALQIPLEGHYHANASGAVTFKIQMSQSSSSPGTVSALTSYQPMRWKIVELDAPLPGPLLIPSSTFITATGGSVTTVSGYRIHQFTTSGNLVVSSVPSGRTVDVFMVGGGGSGRHGSNGVGGGGGGGGGLIHLPGQSIAAGTFPVIIGAGGNDTTGGDTTFNSLVAGGGGLGGIYDDSNGGTGYAGRAANGSGGGGTFGGSGGAANGTGHAGAADGGGVAGGSGGGGAGSTLPTQGSGNSAGAGGNGLAVSDVCGGLITTLFGAGGAGGNGHGGAGTSGAANTGNGGQGGGDGAVGQGGSGVTYVCYPYTG